MSLLEDAEASSNGSTECSDGEHDLAEPKRPELIGVEAAKRLKQGQIRQGYLGAAAESQRNFKESGAMVERKRSDPELVRSSAAGDRDAYRELVERYQQRVFAIAFELLRSREDAEDVAQESFVKAFLSLPEFKGQSSFYTWLYRITYNMAIDFRRRSARRGGQAVEFDEKLMSEGAGEISTARIDRPDQAMIRKEQAGQLRSVLGELSDEHRVVVTLREVDGLSYDEIADVTGISKGTVMSRLHYARKRLQLALIERGVYGEADERARVSDGDIGLKGEAGPGVAVKHARPELG